MITLKSFFERKECSSPQVELKDGHENEVEVMNAYVFSTGLNQCFCGYFENHTLTWVGISLEGLVHDLQLTSPGIFEVKHPFAYHLSTVEHTTKIYSLFSTTVDGKVTLKWTDIC